MHINNILVLLILFSIFIIVHGQLSIDELFYFNSKYTSTGDCSHFQYTFPDFRIKSNNYNQLIFNCDTSSIIFRNQEQTSSLICPTDEGYFQIHFPYLSQTIIQANQLRLHGIELCSLDDLIRNIYHEYSSSYRSQWALLINLKTNNQREQHHLAIAKNDEMTFIVLILSSEYQPKIIQPQIELILPNKNIFKFNQSSINVWRIDQDYVRTPTSLENTIIYQLSKTQFTLFNNETFFLYGTQISYPRRFRVTVDGILLTCNYDYILQCTFPILPSNTHDTDKPILKVVYNGINILNTTLTLIPRTRLDRVPTNHNINDIGTFQVNIDERLCANESLKSSFTFIIHLWEEDSSGIEQYHKIESDDLAPTCCNTTAEIGLEIEKKMNRKLIDDIISMDVDLIHQWHDHRNCATERTRITFV